MEQYAAMSEEQMQSYNLWEQEQEQEQDYYYTDTGEMGMLRLSSQDQLIYAKNASSINHHSTTSYNIDCPNARNVQHQQHVDVSSPETAKPKRRRSKSGAAAAQSTTFLNASISNFRALVQQHTGCHSSPKGPITLCFAAPAEARQLTDHQNQYYYS